MAFNWGALLGWSALAGSLENTASILIPLYCSSICWTLVYDTIYAHQDKSDDISAGIKSTALLFGDQTKLILSGFSVAMLSLFTIAVRNLESSHPMLLNWDASTMSEFLSTGHPFYCASLGVAAFQLAWQIKTVNLNSRADCWSKFRSNVLLGTILWIGLLLDYSFHLKTEKDSHLLK
jgi:4-hydroxybenzoate polyprenyltransferase